VRQHNQIGDMLCSLTLYKALKKKYPKSQITLVAAKTNYQIPFFDLNPYLDRVLVFDKSSLKSILKFFKELRSRKYQIGIVPSTIVLSRTSHIINWISGANIRVGVKSIDGKENRSHKYLNIRSDFRWKEKHQSFRNLEVTKQIDCDLLNEEIHTIKLNFGNDDIAFAKDFLATNFPDQNKSIVAFHPGAGKELCVWNYGNYVNLIKKLYKEFNNYVLITSSWTDNNVVEPVWMELQTINIGFKVLHNMPVKKLGVILSLVDLFITNDTGTMHIAGYSGAKMISLFGPTTPEEWASVRENQKFIKSSTKNINDISVDDVYILAKTFLS
jgi:ADP-heptose:LPS heptosyltransferase